MGNHSRVKSTNEEVHDLTNKHNLTWIGGEYKNSLSRLDFEDSEGYRYNYNTRHFYSNKQGRMIVGIRNPHSIYNLKLYLEKNDKPFSLISTSHTIVNEKFEFKCHVCNSIFDCSWSDVSNAKSKDRLCKTCYPKEYTESEVVARVNNLNSKVTAYSATKEGLSHWHVLVRCKTCNKMWTTWANSLIKGHACLKCNIMRDNNHYNTTIADRNKEEWINKKAIVYVVEMVGNDERFLKIGITSTTVKKRFSSIKNYKVSIIKEIHTNLYDAVYLESDLHGFISEMSYTPLIKFCGQTECFTLDSLPLIQNFLTL